VTLHHKRGPLASGVGSRPAAGACAGVSARSESRRGVISETRATGRAGQRSECEYRRWRARQIAYERWEPWVRAEPVRQHVRSLRRTGASYRAIGGAADVSPMTVHRLLHGEARRRRLPERMHAGEAGRLLAVTRTAAGLAATRRDAAGTRLRLRALVAVGHPAVSLAAGAGLTPRAVWDIVRGTTGTVSPAGTRPSSRSTTGCGINCRRKGRLRSAGPWRQRAAGRPGTAGRRRWAWTTSGSMTLATGLARSGARPPAPGQAQRRRLAGRGAASPGPVPNGGSADGFGRGRWSVTG